MSGQSLKNVLYLILFRMSYFERRTKHQRNVIKTSHEWRRLPIAKEVYYFVSILVVETVHDQGVT